MENTIADALEHSCTHCGADRNVLLDSLKESTQNGLETENHATARHVIENCPFCRVWVKCHAAGINVSRGIFKQASANLDLETRVTALEKDVLLLTKETMIAFKRLVNVELRLEELENKLRVEP